MAIGPALLVILLVRIDRQELLDSLKGARLDYVALACLCTIPALAIRAKRLSLLIGADAGAPKFGSVVNVYAYSILVGTVTPGRLGEFIKVVHLKKWGATLASALTTVFLERLPDILFLMTVGTVSLGLIALPEAAKVSAAVPIVVT